LIVLDFDKKGCYRIFKMKMNDHSLRCIRKIGTLPGFPISWHLLRCLPVRLRTQTGASASIATATFKHAPLPNHRAPCTCHKVEKRSIQADYFN